MAYLGPGDIKSGAEVFAATRAYSAAKAATAPYACMDIVDSSGGNPTTINILSTGAVDYVSLNTFITNHGTPSCTKFWDQTGNARHFVQTGAVSKCPTVEVSPSAGSPAFGANQVCLKFTRANSQWMVTQTNLSSGNQPWTLIGLAMRSGNFTVENELLQVSSSGGTPTSMGWNTSANQIFGYAGTVVNNNGNTDGNWFALSNIFATGAAGFQGINGTPLSVNFGAVALSLDGTMPLYLGASSADTNTLDGRIAEAGYWPAANSWASTDIPFWGTRAGTVTDGSVTYYFSIAPVGSTQNNPPASKRWIPYWSDY